MLEETYCIYDLLNEMREKPAMFMGCKSIIRLSAYLQGYRHAMGNLGINENSSPAFWSVVFDDWISARLGYGRSAAGWCNTILAETLGWPPEHQNWERLNQGVELTDDAAALDRFYELLDEYRREYILIEDS